MRAINQNRVARKSCSKNWKLRRSWTVIKTNKGFYVIKKIDERCRLLRSGAKHKWRIFELKISLRTFFVLRAGWLPSRVRCDVAASAVSNDAHLGWCWGRASDVAGAGGEETDWKMKEWVWLKIRQLEKRREMKSKQTRREKNRGAFTTAW